VHSIKFENEVKIKNIFDTYDFFIVKKEKMLYKLKKCHGEDVLTRQIITN